MPEEKNKNDGSGGVQKAWEKPYNKCLKLCPEVTGKGLHTRKNVFETFFNISEPNCVAVRYNGNGKWFSFLMEGRLMANSATRAVKEAKVDTITLMSRQASQEIWVAKIVEGKAEKLNPE